MTTQHDPQLLGAYVLGAMDEQEVREMDQHLASCPDCTRELEELRAMEAYLGEVPPEAMLDGPPEGGDLLLQRTLRQVRAERGGVARRRQFALGAAAAVVAALVLGAGVFVGKATSPDVTALPTPTVAPDPAGTKLATFTDPVTKASMTVKVIPAAGWVRTNIAVNGIPEGEKCRIFVVAKDGSRQEAGSWVVSKKGAAEGANLDGAALVAPDDVKSVLVENFAGKKFVEVPVQA
ncbi:anti-sigma factor family protein [Lentzea rhizosphaerae]|uniref:Anti-sigma factor family protein n=1 Tax=Lentzea rhizosphaerae TaxID=2041025 RepID=A0ABV8C1Y5_9PSEU|nr:zf-HC2 domain-containing protein [Lentzea aerocolonigenes]MCP2246704.1 putative zinc-finger [Lentzea aerocolonigenes]